MIAAIAVFFLGLVGLALAGAALCMPIGMRGIDPAVLAEAGRGTAQFHQAAQLWTEADKPGTATMFENAVVRLRTERNELAIMPVVEPGEDVGLHLWGGHDPFLEQIFDRFQPTTNLSNPPVLPLFIPRESRRALSSFLESSRNPAVRAVLANRRVAYAERFMPVDSSAGQPLEGTLYLTALLLQGNHFSQAIASDIRQLAENANEENKLGGVEAIYLDMLALGSRMQWQALVDLMPLLEDRRSLRNAAHLARVLEADWVVFAAAALWTRTPSDVSHYLIEYGEQGMDDLKGAILQGRGAVDLLLARQASVQEPAWRSHVPFLPILFPELFTRTPEMAVGLKVGGLLLGLFILFLAINLFTQIEAHGKTLGRPFGFTVVQASLLSVALGVTFLLFSEPLLLPEGLKSEFRLQLPIPIASTGADYSTEKAISINMDQLTLISLSVFFALQLITYIICWIKVMEIRRQPIASQLKLRLLENEDHLFDAGLYIGLAGTVGALIFLALGVIGPSLMAAYASTLFGIVFVALFKICHLRPYRRRLIIESQASI